MLQRECESTSGSESVCNRVSGGGVAVAYGIDTYNMAVTGDVSSSLGTNCGMSTGRNGVVTGVDIYNQTLTGGGIKNAE